LLLPSLLFCFSPPFTGVAFLPSSVSTNICRC
jgi:hypothetical protein